MSKEKKAEMKRTVKRAKRLLKAIEKHAQDAIDHGIPRALYVQSVADHAGSTFDRLTGTTPAEPDDS